MTMIAAEGFVHFNTLTDWGLKGNNGGSNVTFSSTSGRGGRGGVTNGLNASTYKVLSVSNTTVFDHRAIMTVDRTRTELIEFRSGTDAHCFARSQADGTIEVMRAVSPFSGAPFDTVGATTLVTSNPGIIRNNVQHHIQTKFKVDASSGVFEMYVDGILALTFSGNTYCGTGAVTITQTGFGTNAGGTGVTVSDWVVFNDQGSLNNTYGGDLACYEQVSPVDGDELQWIRSTGAGTWSSHVDDNPENGDTDYISSAVSGDRNCFSFPAWSAAIGTPVAIKETVCHRKVDASLGLIKLYSRSNDAVDHDGSNVSVAQNYKFDERIYEQDLKDNSSWTVAKVNATQLGIKNAS